MGAMDGVSSVLQDTTDGARDHEMEVEVETQTF